MKTWFVLFLTIMALVAGAVACHAGGVPTPADVQAGFHKLLGNAKVTSVKASPIPGVYEAIAEGHVFYVAPEGKGYAIMGQIVDSDGRNLTAEVQQAVQEEQLKVLERADAEKLKGIDLGLAVKIGNGPNIIIEFTDPDCPYCRRLDAFLSGRDDVTRYVFLNPLDQIHPNSRAKAIYILNSKESAKAMHEVFSGKYDNGPLPIAVADIGKYPAAVKRLDAGMQIGRELGVEGTPMLFVNGRIVQGADTDRITSLLKH